MHGQKRMLSGSLVLVIVLGQAYALRASETLNELIAGAKKEKEQELVMVAGGNTFGGRKAFSELERIFNKKYGLSARLTLVAGPSLSPMAARVITELKTKRKSSTAVYIGYIAQFALLHQENALAKVDWSRIFPWITREMEIFPSEGVLLDASFNGPIYNSNFIPKEKAPKRYEDLIDPRLSPTWAGKLAIPPYTTWLTELSLIWGEEKVKDFTRKLVALSGGRIRYGDEERIVSGEFPIMADVSNAPGRARAWQAKGAPLDFVLGSVPPVTVYTLLGVPLNSARPNLTKLLVGLMLTKKAQAITEKFNEGATSPGVPCVWATILSARPPES